MKSDSRFTWNYKEFIEEYNNYARGKGLFDYIEEPDRIEALEQSFYKLGISIKEYAKVILYCEQEEILVPKYRHKHGLTRPYLGENGEIFWF